MIFNWSSPNLWLNDELTQVQDIAGTILYLVSRAGWYVNGIVLFIDGGTLSVRGPSFQPWNGDASPTGTENQE